MLRVIVLDTTVLPMHFTAYVCVIDNISARRFIKYPLVTRAFVTGRIITARYTEERDDRALRHIIKKKSSFVAHVEYRISPASPRINERLSSRISP